MFFFIAATFDPGNSDEAWRYVGNRVWTGEGFVYAPPPPPEEPMDFESSQNSFLPQTGTSKVPGIIEILAGSPQAEDLSYFGNPQGSGSSKNTTRSLLVPLLTHHFPSFWTSKFPWHDNSTVHEQASTARQRQVPICRVEQ